LSTSNKFSI